MTWQLLLLFCFAASDCRVLPMPMAGDGFQSQLECMMRGSEEAKKRGATTFRCRSRVGQELEI